MLLMIMIKTLKVIMASICRHFKEDFEQAIVQLSEPLIDASLDLYKWEKIFVINMMMLYCVELSIVMMVVRMKIAMMIVTHN